MQYKNRSDERRSLGEPLVDHNGVAEMDWVTLEGRIEAPGDLCELFEDGALVAAATAGLLHGTLGVLTVAAVRAARLTLVTAKALQG